MIKNMLLTSVIMAVATVSVANADSSVTSKTYVDTEVAAKQNKIPATGTNSGTLGTAVVTYTTTAGTVGERGIYDGSTTYAAGTDANKLVTASALNSSVTTLPSIVTSKMVCGNAACTVWTITDQNVYGESNQSNNNQQ